MVLAKSFFAARGRYTVPKGPSGQKRKADVIGNASY
jgi:hypothetical protein